MARYWVEDASERGPVSADPATVHTGRPARTSERERIADALRRTLAGNVTSDDD